MAVANPLERAGSPRSRREHGQPLETLLSRREWEVVEELSKGATNGEIAAGLGVSVHTVKSHVKMILLKLDAKNRTAAAIRYERLRNGTKSLT